MSGKTTHMPLQVKLLQRSKGANKTVALTPWRKDYLTLGKNFNSMYSKLMTIMMAFAFKLQKKKKRKHCHSLVWRKKTLTQTWTTFTGFPQAKRGWEEKTNNAHTQPHTLTLHALWAYEIWLRIWIVYQKTDNWESVGCRYQRMRFSYNCTERN